MPTMADLPGPERRQDQEVSPVQALEQRLGRNFPALTAARELARNTRAELAHDLAGIVPSDLSIVTFGSLARDEFTEDSDVDWSLLIDGQADPTHLDTAKEVAKVLAKRFKEPGREGVFGKMTFSHELIHLIGGESDTNSNTTRRALLLLESVPLIGEQVHTRVVRSILKRYLLEEPTFARRTKPYHVPRFLLNDFARYWRTMAVDFAYKSRTRRGEEGLALRRIKLRTSRKLIFVSGLLSCFSCELGVARSGGLAACRGSEEECVDCLRNLMRLKPLEIFATTALHLADRWREEKEQGRGDRVLKVAASALEAYDQFLGIVSDKKKREKIHKLAEDSFESSPPFVEAKKICDDFRDAIEAFFFDVDDHLGRLIRHYGVF
jgi:predicted nucleotidyltransferase